MGLSTGRLKNYMSKFHHIFGAVALSSSGGIVMVGMLSIP